MKSVKEEIGRNICVFVRDYVVVSGGNLDFFNIMIVVINSLF